MYDIPIRLANISMKNSIILSWLAAAFIHLLDCNKYQYSSNIHYQFDHRTQ